MRTKALRVIDVDDGETIGYVILEKNSPYTLEQVKDALNRGHPDLSIEVIDIYEAASPEGACIYFDDVSPYLPPLPQW